MCKRGARAPARARATMGRGGAARNKKWWGVLPVRNITPLTPTSPWRLVRRRRASRACRVSRVDSLGCALCCILSTSASSSPHPNTPDEACLFLVRCFFWKKRGRKTTLFVSCRKRRNHTPSVGRPIDTTNPLRRLMMHEPSHATENTAARTLCARCGALSFLRPKRRGRVNFII